MTINATTAAASSPPAIVVHDVPITVDGFRAPDSWRTTIWEDYVLFDSAELESRHIAAYVATALARARWGANAYVDVDELVGFSHVPGGTWFRADQFDAASERAVGTLILVKDRQTEALRELLIAADQIEQHKVAAPPPELWQSLFGRTHPYPADGLMTELPH